MNDIPEEALKIIEERFETRFVRHAASEEGPEAERPFASVFPESIEEIQLLARLPTRYRLPVMARGASTALYSGKALRTLEVRFDTMRGIRLPEESAEKWVEIDPLSKTLPLQPTDRGVIHYGEARRSRKPLVISRNQPIGQGILQESS